MAPQRELVPWEWYESFRDDLFRSFFMDSFFDDLPIISIKSFSRPRKKWSASFNIAPVVVFWGIVCTTSMKASSDVKLSFDPIIINNGSLLNRAASKWKFPLNIYNQCRTARGGDIMIVATHCGILELALPHIMLPYEYPTNRINLGGFFSSDSSDCFDFVTEDPVVAFKCCPVKRKFAASLTLSTW